MGSLGRSPNVSGWTGLFGSDEIHGDEGVRVAELASSGTDQFSTGAVGGGRGDHGASLVFKSVPRDASYASPPALWRHCRGTLSSYSDAAGLGGMYYLGTGLVSVALRRWDTAALFDLHITHCRNGASAGREPWTEALPTGSAHRLCASRDRSVRRVVGNQPIADCHWLRRFFRQRIQGPQHSNRPRFSSRHSCPQRLHLLGDRRAMGFCWGDDSNWRIRVASLDLSLRGVFRQRSIWPPPCNWNYGAHFHPRFPEHWNDYFDAAHYGSSIAPH